MCSRFTILVVTLLLAPLCWGQSAERIIGDQYPTTIIGPRNLPLHDGAQALLAGDIEEGVRLTHEGLAIAMGRREEEAALSNLCAGYIKLGRYSEALKYCNILLARNDKNWRGYNNRAVVYIQTKQWKRAEMDLIKGEELNPDAHTMKVARAMYMDAVHPVSPEIEIDDRQNNENEDPE
jgi:tetratricopeptide (TPR) repeat protein